jgi:fermentation-respiration switch protein FrsA (DUF1100 family)
MKDNLATRSDKRETVIFAVAVAVLALHTIADAFLLPEHGTVWSDHLLPGLGTLGVLLLSAGLYLLGRAGLRGSLALVLGALALEGCAIAVMDAGNVGPRGDDWTGFLLGPAGLALWVLGVGLLWHSRKSGRLRHLRRLGLALAGVVIAYALVVPVGVAILATHRPRQPVADVVLGRPYQRADLQTSDGLELGAWYVPSRNGAAVISYPTRSGKLSQARMLVRHGYGVLLVDARGYDGSQGDPNLFGWDDTPDINAAVAWLQHQPDVRGGRIGGIGFSVGGEMMLQAAAGNTRLKAVVSDGAGFRSVREEVLYGPRGWFTSLPEQVVQSAALTVLSGTPPPPSLKDLVPRLAPRPVFFVYAGHGVGGEEYNPAYYRAAHAPKALWEIPEAHHTRGYEARPHQYEQRVVGFFDRALLGRE